MDHIYSDDNRILKIILPLYLIPDGEKVVKIKGQKQYTVTSSIRVFNKDCETKEIKVDDNCKFLIEDDSDGSINVVGGDIEHVWLVDNLEILETFLDNFYDRIDHYGD